MDYILSNRIGPVSRRIAAAESIDLSTNKLQTNFMNHELHWQPPVLRALVVLVESIKWFNKMSDIGIRDPMTLNENRQDVDKENSKFKKWKGTQ